MRKTGYALFLVALFLAYSCNNSQDALEDTLPEFYILTTQVSPQEGGTIQPESGEYLAGNSIQVEAIAAEGYVFVEWEGALSGNSNPATLQLNSNSTVGANFTLKNYSLNIDVEGSGTVREVVVDRSDSVTVRLEADADEGWTFLRWEGDLSGSNNPETLAFEDDEEKNITAVFAEDAADEYSLSIDTEGEGSVDIDPEQESYTDGDEVTLTAEAASGWSFAGWQGDLSGSDNPATITIDEDKEVTAVFEQDEADAEYSLSVNTEGEGSVDIDPEQESYTDGDEVTLTAEAASGWSFAGWQGDLSGSTNPETITIDEDKSVTAIFEQDAAEEFSLTINTEGQGSVTADPDQETYTDGDEVTLTAEAASGWSFAGWQGDLSGSTNPETITMDGDKSVTAIFEQDPAEEFSLTVNTEGQGSVNVDPDQETYTDGDEVTLTAEAASGWSFAGWQGDLSGSTNPETITMDGDKSVTAIFEQDPAEEFSLTVNTEGQGSVNVDPDQNTYTDGDEVTLTASAASGWSFAGWQGDLSGSTNPETITIDEDKTVTAIFEQDAAEEFSLTVNTQGEGSVNIDPDQETYTDGDEVTLTASAASGWSFAGWQGDLSGDDNPATITLDEDKNVTAVFEQDPAEEFSLIANTQGDGSVNKDPDQETYTDGDEVTLTAQAASGWRFAGWQGDLSGSSNPETITMDGDKSVTAIFEQDAVMGITINEVKMFIEKMELGGGRQTKKFSTEDFILTLPLDGSPFQITHEQIPAGFYDELELEIKKPGRSADLNDPDFGEGSGRYSLVVNGIFNGNDFTFQSDEKFEIDVDISPHLEIVSGQTSVIAIDIHFENWFRGEGDQFLDPSDSGNAERINKNIEDSFSDFEDGF